MISLRILDDAHRIPLEDAADLLKVSMATIRRYCRGDLEYMRTGPRPGGKYLTSREAIERYLAKLNGVDAVPESPARRTKRREAELAKVDRELAAAGWA